MSSRDVPCSVIPSDGSPVMLLLVSCRTCFMSQELQHNHCLTIILHGNGFGTQVQWHFTRDWEVGPGSKMRRDGEKQMLPCMPPGEGRN